MPRPIGACAKGECLTAFLGERLQSGNVSRECEIAIADGEGGERIKFLHGWIVPLNDSPPIDRWFGGLG